MEHWLDNYIYGKNLTDEQLRYMWTDPLNSFAYLIADDADYERIKGRLAILQMSLWKGAYFKDVSYILDHTGLTKWQKFWLKFQYLFL
jgi:hypothetical protein